MYRYVYNTKIHITTWPPFIFAQKLIIKEIRGVKVEIQIFTFCCSFDICFKLKSAHFGYFQNVANLKKSE